MIEEKIITIFDHLIRDIRAREEECYRKMAFCNEHKFEMEREAVRYSQKAYNSCWLKVSDARDKIMKLIQEKNNDNKCYDK